MPMTTNEEYNSLPPFQSELRKVSTTPENNVYADRGTHVVDKEGRHYGKRTAGTAKTGWVPLTQIQIIDLLASLAGLTIHQDNDIVIVLGATAKFDEGHGAGFWIYQSDSTDAEDAHHVKPTDVATGDPGRWILFDNSWTT